MTELGEVGGEPRRLEPLLARLELIGGPDDTRPVEDVLEDLDRQTAEISRVVGEDVADEKRTKLISEVERLRESVLEGPAALGELREKIAAARRALGVVEVRTVLPAADRVLARLGRGPLLHIRTGLDTLDNATRDGLLSSRVHMIGGEPDAGKTAILVQIGLHAARNGYAVAIHAVDEPGDGIEDRIGQAWGASLEDMEAAAEEAILHLSGQLRSVPELVLVDQVEDGFTVEDSAEMILAHAKKLGLKGAMLCVDSFQTARCRGMSGAGAPRDPRDRLEMLSAVLRDLARRGLCIVCTSELNRNFYKEKEGARGRAQPSEMGAFKGTGSIEYLMTTGMLVTRLKTGEHAGDYRVALPKNKRGDKAAFRLSFDRERCVFTDCGRFDEQPSDEGAAPETKAAPEKPISEHVLERVRFALKSRPRGLAGGIEALIEAAKPIKTSLARRAIRQLQAADEIVRQGDRLYHRDQAPPPKPPPDPSASAAELRARVMAWFEAQLAAGRLVPSRRAVVQGLREADQGARKGDVDDAVAILVDAGDLLEAPGGALSLR